LLREDVLLQYRYSHPAPKVEQQEEIINPTKFHDQILELIYVMYTTSLEGIQSQMHSNCFEQNIMEQTAVNYANIEHKFIVKTWFWASYEHHYN